MKPAADNLKTDQWNLVYRRSKKTLDPAVRRQVRWLFKWRFRSSVDSFRELIFDTIYPESER